MNKIDFFLFLGFNKNFLKIKSIVFKKLPFALDCVMKINNNFSISGCPRGGMVDTRDLKSLGLIGRASSSLAVGTRYMKYPVD